MEQVFLKVLSMSITAGYCVLVVLLLRLFLRKLPKIYSYILWLVVGFRLVCPFSLKSTFSLMRMQPQRLADQLQKLEQSPIPTVGVDAQTQVLADEVVNQTGMAMQNYGQTLPPEGYQNGMEIATTYGRSFLENPMQTTMTLAMVVWVIVAAALLVYSAWTILRLKRNLRAAIPVESNVYETENILTPFVYGIFRPRIYLPHALQGEERKFVLLHEQTHVRRRDYLIKQVAYLLVCVHWFNPLIWVAFYLMCQDMEMSCDESVIRHLGKEQKSGYSATLLALASGKKIALGGPLAFGEGGIKKRIVNVLHYKRPAFWMSVLLLVVLVGILVGLSVNPGEEKTAEAEVKNQDEQPSAMEEVKVASGVMHMGNGNTVTVELIMTEGVYFEEEYDAASIYVYEENYKGNYELRTFDESGNLLASLDLHDVLRGAGDEETFNFPGEFTIPEADYNADGCPDFTIGQTGSSSINFYTLLTVRENGTIEKLCEKEIPYSEGKDFSVVFRQNTQQEQRPILTSVWNNALSEAEQHRYNWNEAKGMYEEAETGANGEPLDPDSFSQAIHYKGYLDESPYTEWNPGWENCDFDEDGLRDRIYRDVAEEEIAYRIEFGNGENLAVGRSEDYFMGLGIQTADVCGDSNPEILFKGFHWGSTAPDCTVTIFEKTENGYEQIPLCYLREYAMNVNGAVWLYDYEGNPVYDFGCPTADFETEYDWESWCENKAWDVLHFDSVGSHLVVDAEFAVLDGTPCFVLYQNIGDKWLYKKLGFVFEIGEQKPDGTGRELTLRKIVPEKLETDMESEESAKDTTNWSKDKSGKYILEYADFNEYSGYLDEIANLEDYGWWYFDFANADFDGDGFLDRVYMETKIEENEYRKVEHYYRIEFGNGNVAEIGPFSEFSFNLQCADLTGDGVQELVFVSAAVQSTNPHSGNLAIYKKQGDTYVMMEVPVVVKEKWMADYADPLYRMGYEIMVLDVSKDKVRVGIPDYDLEATFKIDGEKAVHGNRLGESTLKKYYQCMKNENESIGRDAWTVEVLEYEGKTALDMWIEIEPEPKMDLHEAVVTVVFDNGAWTPIAFRVEE